MQNHGHGQGGFTLLEIMLVVMIIAILVGGAVIMVGPTLGAARTSKIGADLLTLKTSLTMYDADTGAFPTAEQGLKALVEKPINPGSKWRKLMDEVPEDPWHRPYYYECPGTHNPDSYDLYSAGQDGKPGTADDIGNWKSQVQ